MTDVVDVVLDGNNIEFCRVEGTGDSVSVSTTKNNSHYHHGTRDWLTKFTLFN